MLFHFIDVYDLFPEYRLHTPAELLKRNHASQRDVVRDVVLQHVIQTIVGLVVSYFDPVEFTGGEEYDVAVWARRIRIIQRSVPRLLALLGIDSVRLADVLSRYGFVVPAQILSGGAVERILLKDSVPVPTFAPWELAVARSIYWGLIPMLQFAWAVFALDTWQYFWHRAMHLNLWLYCRSSSPVFALDFDFSNMRHEQPNFTHDIIVYMFPMHSVPSTTIRWKGLSSIPPGPAWRF